MSETRVFAGTRKVARSVAGAVVGHDALDLNAQLCAIGNRGFEESYGGALFLVGLDLGERDTGVVVDADMDKLPAHSIALALPITTRITWYGDVR
jgi:hypothetical protein